MKIQSLAVIFAIIVLPIIIILSYYIHGQIDTIALQIAYDTKLIDSTHDAMASFEINTANENLSSVADSLRSIIEASTNVFFNTLATNFGISNAGNSAVDSYIPAILYTLYDGYYIYSPTRNPTILTYNGDDIVYVGDRGVTFQGEQSYVNENGKTVNFGVYSFDQNEYAKEKDDDITNNESEDARNIRQKTLYDSLPNSIKYEFGQMLYQNEDGSYSAMIHTNRNNPGAGNNTKYKQDHVLKSYMPYSARYTRAGAFDVTINYTLDNYLTVEGNIGSSGNEVYFSKTGYLISKDTVTSIDVGGITDILTYNEHTAEEMILSGQNDITLKINPIMENNQRMTTTGHDITITYNTADADGLNYTKIRERLTKLYEDQDANLDEIRRLEYAAQTLSSICYYVKAQIFSNWIYDNLGGTESLPGNGIRASDISDEIASLNDTVYTTDSNFDVFHKFKMYDSSGNLEYEDRTIIFDTSANPELEDSPFYTHKLDVVRNNIQYNLNLAISNYNQMLRVRNVQMPVIADNQWEQILTRVSIVSFMQGLNCGMKNYNNYAIASSTNNEISVIPSEMYYTYQEQYNSAEITDEYHRIDCDKLLDIDDAGNEKKFISFKSKEVKYDKIFDKVSKRYLYDHRNVGCYRCAIASNYEKDVYDTDGNPARGYSDDVQISLLSPVKQKAYYIAVGKERQNLYKTNAITDSNGYEVIYNSAAVNGEDISLPGNGSRATIVSGVNSKRPISEIREIEVTLGSLKGSDSATSTVNLRLIVNGQTIDYPVVFNLDQEKPQTMVVPIHLNTNVNLNTIEVMKIDTNDSVTAKKLNARIVYE